MFNALTLDLHGKSLEEGQAATNDIIEEAIEKKIKKVLIITGRGHHPSATGERGIFFKRLPKWLGAKALRSHIQYVIKKVGAYEIILKGTSIQQHKNTHQNKTDDFLEGEDFSDPSELMQALSTLDTPENRERIKNIIAKNPKLLEKVSSHGTTVLMIAASKNQVELMELLLLQDRIFSLEPKLLKQARQDGTHVLMIAIIYEQIEAMEFLLREASSLLKKKRLNGESVFTLAARTRDPEKMLEVLYKHLEEHKREKGYTDLFREYKILKREMAIKNMHASIKRKVPVIESSEFKRYKITHAWFFSDRMQQFLEHFRSKHEEIKKLAQKMKSINKEVEDILKIKRSFIDLLGRNTSIRRLFLRFNHIQKLKVGRRFKHAIQYPVLVHPVREHIQVTKKKKVKNKKMILKKPEISKLIINKHSQSQAMVSMQAWQSKAETFKYLNISSELARVGPSKEGKEEKVFSKRDLKNSAASITKKKQKKKKKKSQSDKKENITKEEKVLQLMQKADDIPEKVKNQTSRLLIFSDIAQKVSSEEGLHQSKATVQKKKRKNFRNTKD